MHCKLIMEILLNYFSSNNIKILSFMPKDCARVFRRSFSVSVWFLKGSRLIFGMEMQETNFYVLFRYSVGFRLLIAPSNKHICAYNNKCISFKVVAEPSLTFAVLVFFFFVRFADAIRKFDSACSTSTDNTDKRS